MDWSEVRQKAYGRVEAELQKQIQLESENPDDYKGVTAEEMANQILETIGT